ncbi:hypothetical protein HDU76_013874 [Blyttiomyces sp. JEL0837]|nr:hypothetical protein HDU76_013874 [Blyttiomyces sp. JEL0837]
MFKLRNVCNLVRVNNWDPNEPERYTVVNSGGYASVKAMEVAQNKNVIAAMGEFYSKTSIFRIVVIIVSKYCRICKLVKLTKVKRVAIISSFEPLSLATRLFAAKGINILTSIYISADAYNNNDYTQADVMLKEVDARYVIVIAGPSVTADF